jgi:O-antigen ligase
MVAAAASLLVVRDRIAGLDAYRLLILQPALLYAVVRSGGPSGATPQRLADAFVLGGLALAALGLWHYFGADYVERAEGARRLLVPFYDSPNHISLYLGRTAAMACCFAAAGAARPRRMAHAFASVAMLVAIYLTYSRAAWLLGLPAAAVVVAFAAWRRPSSGSPVDHRLLLVLGVVAVALISLLPALGAPRFSSLLDVEGGTAGSRLLIWQAAARMIAAHPLLGVGIGNFYAQYPRYMLPEAWREPLLYHAHNAALDFWSMLGIVGVAAFVWLEVAFWQMALRLRRAPLSQDDRALLFGLMGGMAYALAHGLVDTLYFLPDLALAFMLTIGMTVALHQADH